MNQDHDDLNERLLVWQDRRARGDAPSASALCLDRPELAAELGRRIDALQSMEQLLGMADPAVTVEAGPMAGLEVHEIPGYEILHEVDRGGMGIVYQARQTNLNRRVALKMIRAGGEATPAQRERFRSEAAAIARLQHPNIVQIHDVGEAGGRPFYAMEFVEGGSLADALRDGPIPACPAAELIRTLAHAIEAAHQAGLVHRDLKPSNILLHSASGTSNSPSNGVLCDKRLSRFGSPKIADFGLAKQILEPGSDGPAPLTETGAVLGTPSYMAPEQAEGKTRTVGPAADIWALGAILYECLVGRPPFRGETPFDTLQQVRSLDPVAPRQLQPRLPRDLETICLKCLNKNPARRYPSAEALAEDLTRFLNNETILARPASIWERGFSWARKRPVSAVALTLSLAALLAILGLWVHFTILLKEQRSAAVRAKLDAEREEKLAKERLEEIERQKARADAMVRRICSVVDESSWAHFERKGEVVREMVPGGISFNLARVNALASASVHQDPTLDPTDRDRVSQQYASRAVGHLRQARDAGFFDRPGAHDRLKTEKDLDPIRDRSDFQAMLSR